jgi:hypothetical protein
MKASSAFAVLALALLSALLSACAASRPVIGQMERSDETFRGNVSGGGYRSGTGNLTIVSSHNATCRGNFVYTSRRKGQGVLNCDDGRTGPFFMSGFDEVGSGYGDLAGQRFTFTFGS